MTYGQINRNKGIGIDTYGFRAYISGIRYKCTCPKCGEPITGWHPDPFKELDCGVTCTNKHFIEADNVIIERE